MPHYKQALVTKVEIIKTVKSCCVRLVLTLVINEDLLTHFWHSRSVKNRCE